MISNSLDESIWREVEAGANLADGLLHLVEVRGLVEVGCHQLRQQRGQHVGEREQDQARDCLRVGAPTAQCMTCSRSTVGTQRGKGWLP